MDNLQRKFKFYKMLREMHKNRSINEYHYQSSEGENNFDSYDSWETALKTKYPTAQIVREWDTIAGVDGREQVGFWDEQIQSGVVYDLNIVSKESIDNDTFQTDTFSEDEVTKIKTIYPEALNTESGLVVFGNYALIKFKSGVVELMKKDGTEYQDFKPFQNFDEMIQNLKDAIPPTTKVIESVNFNIEGFKQNMNEYVNDIDSCITYDEAQKLYSVVIPFSKLKSKIGFAFTDATTSNETVANKIVKIANLYPRCLTAHIEAARQEIRMIFTNK